MTDKCFAALRPVFQKYVDQLRKTPPVASRELPAAKGLYALSENGTFIYVGITENIKRRLQMHCFGAASGASFAVRLAREETSNKPAYTTAKGLKALLSTEPLRSAFKRARKRIRQMEVRCLMWEADDSDLAVLEMYMARELNTLKYNEFRTH